jgi:hypothetical protein
MLNWDTLIPTSPHTESGEVGHAEAPAGKPENPAPGHPQATAPDTQAGHDWQGKQPELHEKAAFVPACPGNKPPLSRLNVHDMSLINNGIMSFVPVVPVVPAKNQEGGCSTSENGAHGGGAAEKNFAPENEGSSVSYPLNPAAVCLVVAACERSPRKPTPEQMGQHILSLHRLPPAEQVRHWHGVCRQQGLLPWRVLSFESPGEGKDCGMCAHLDSILDYVEGDERRHYRWACKRGYLILEYGRATERVMLAPPECGSWERFYPGPWR